MYRSLLPEKPELRPFPSYLHEIVTLPAYGNRGSMKKFVPVSRCSNMHYPSSLTQLTVLLISLLLLVAK